jgi:hypothetical protein
MGDMRNAHKILARNLEWKRPCRRPAGRWKDNIRMNLCEMVGESVEWMHLA